MVLSRYERNYILEIIFRVTLRGYHYRCISFTVCICFESSSCKGVYANCVGLQVVQYLVLFSLAIFFGLRLAKRTGFGMPILEGVLKKEKRFKDLKPILGLSISMGVLAAVLIIALSFLYSSVSISVLKLEAGISLWKLFLVCFYGGVAEEILLRLFLMTLLVWISTKITRTSDGGPTTPGIWIAIIVSAVIFGLAHLPITGSFAALSLTIVIRAILLNGVAGIIFGWLYWKKGLESAMIAHFSADFVLHFILPIIGRSIIS